MSTTGEESVAARVAAVRDRIDAAARTAGRSPDAVRLVAATKTQTVDAVRAVAAAGVTDLGENRAQELVAKAPELAGSDPTWHFVGRLQRNKVNQLAPWVRWWQSVDRAELVDGDRHAGARGAGARRGEPRGRGAEGRLHGRRRRRAWSTAPARAGSNRWG